MASKRSKTVEVFSNVSSKNRFKQAKEMNKIIQASNLFAFRFAFMLNNRIVVIIPWITPKRMIIFRKFLKEIKIVFYKLKINKMLNYGF
jgi:hypothetical protein